MKFSDEAANRDKQLSEWAALLKSNKIIDESFYLEQYPDVKASGVDPATHFALHGFREHRYPSPDLKSAVDSIFESTSGSPKSFSTFMAALVGQAVRSLPITSDTKQPQMVLAQGSYEGLYGMPLTIDWNITHNCNYKCSYCTERDYPRSGKFAPFTSLINAVDNLASLNRPRYHFVLLGGEPTVHPHILDLMYLIESRLGSKLNTMGLVTNASRSIDFFKQVYVLAQKTQVALYISMHLEQCSPDHIFQIIRETSDLVYIDINLLFHPEKTAQIREIYEELSAMRKEFAFNLKIVNILAYPSFISLDSRYTKEMLNWRNQAQEKFWALSSASPVKFPQSRAKGYSTFHNILDSKGYHHIARGNRDSQYAQGLFDFKGMYCALGATKLHITETGEVLGAVCQHGMLPYNIHTKQCFQDSSYLRLVRCPQEKCWCSSNDVSAKFRDKGEADCYIGSVRKKQDRLFAEARRGYDEFKYLL